MRVVRFNPKNHYKYIHGWHKSRGMNPPDEKSMPKVGFVVFNKADPISAGFIRKVEGGFGQLDGLISNPLASPEDRNEAIDIVVVKILNKAKELGIPHLHAFCADERTLTRSIKHGFVKFPQHSFIVVDLLKG